MGVLKEKDFFSLPLALISFVVKEQQLRSIKVFKRKRRLREVSPRENQIWYERSCPFLFLCLPFRGTERGSVAVKGEPTLGPRARELAPPGAASEKPSERWDLAGGLVQARGERQLDLWSAEALGVGALAQGELAAASPAIMNAGQ